MNKGKMTSKALKGMFSYELKQKRVFSIGYCTLQYLLHFHSPTFYTCGGYGWNYDSYYIVDTKNSVDYVINTGYRGMFGYSVDYDLSTVYENKAAAIVNDYSIEYEEREARVEALLLEYLNRAAFIEKTAN